MFVADLAPPHLRGRYQGVYAMAFTGAFAAAPVVGGYVIAHAGARWLWVDCDFIVVGGGIGGAVLAELLGRGKKNVVVLEKCVGSSNSVRPEVL